MMSLTDFCTIKYRNRPREYNRGSVQQNWDFQRKVGKVTIPSYDGLAGCTARAWVQKLDNYFQLNPMMEVEAIMFATLHLEGEAHEWWYHGLITLGHSHVTSYLDFTQMLIDRFDRKDPELYFRELAQIRQTGMPYAYMAEFHRTSMMVTDVSEDRLTMLFIEGLVEPLRGWIKVFRPKTLQEAITKTRDMEGAVPKTRFPSKIIPPMKGRDRKPFQKEWTGKPKMDDDTRNELRWKKLCFSCRDPWAPGHRCTGKG